MSTETQKATNTHYEMLSDAAWRELHKHYSLEVNETWTGRQGYGMNAELIRKSDGKKIADVHDDANGGEIRIACFHKIGGPTTASTEDYQGFLGYVAKLPPYEHNGRTFKTTADIAISAMAEFHDMRNAINETGKNLVSFINPDTPDGKMAQIVFPKGTSLEKAAVHIRIKNPNAIIINELL